MKFRQTNHLHHIRKAKAVKPSLIYYQYEIEYQAEEYLALAENQLFIEGDESYHFTNNTIKAYFRMRLSKREKYYHRKFADYLQKRHPEDYFSRGKHLMLSLQTNDQRIILESWQLLLLSYVRRSTEIGDTCDVYNILKEVEILIKRLPSISSDAQRYVLQEFLLGYQEFVKYNYREALQHFQAITPSRLTLACLAECQRLILLCYIQLAENHSMILQTAEELYNTIEIENICEDEQYCRAVLVLLDVYLDRSSNQQRVNILKNRFIRIVQNHLGQPIFEEFEACYNRKAALHYAATVAYRQTLQSVNFYRYRHNRNDLYMALCNHSANSIVSGQYVEAKLALEECENMLRCNEGRYYPSQYKIKNNRILLEYLIEEKEGDNILVAAQTACNAFNEIINHQDDEVSHVILFNYIGLSMLCDSNNWKTELEKANNQLTELDEYYQYFLHDLNYAVALLQNNIISARHELNLLKQLDVPLLRHYKPIFLRRRCVQEELLNCSEKLKGNPLEYHKRISASCTHVQDASCYFYGRGFLLSDLQFLSF